MAAHLTEEEQIENLKRFWTDYGTILVVAVVLGLGGFFAWNQYQKHQQEKAREISVIYEKFAKAVTETEGELSAEEAAKAKPVAEELIAQDETSLYADFARLFLAKLAVQQQDLAAAKATLEKVANQGANDSVKELARLRLARVHAAAGEVDQALNLLSNKASPAYAAAYAEAKGDLLLAQQRVAEARTAYEAALQAMGTSQPMRRNLVQLKIDNTRTSADDPAIPEPGANPHGINPHQPNPHAPAPAKAEGA